MNKSKSGFTIVELLIVIVVIGILAAITIIAFNGVQQKAENTKTLNAISAYSKVLNAYATDVATYPAISYPCLGPAGTRCANLTDGAASCGSAGGAGGATTTTFLSMLTPYASSISAPSTQNMPCGGKQYGGAFYSSGGLTAQITFYLNGLQQCPSALGLWGKTGQTQIENVTICTGTLPAL